MARYAQWSTGGEVFEQSRIAEASQKRIMREQARLREKAEERQYERALEERERQRGFAEEERKRQRISTEQAKQAVPEKTLRELELAGEEHGMGTTETRTGGYRPTTGRIQSEQVYRTMPTSEKMKYLRGSVPMTEPSRERAKLREDIEAYGGTAPPDMSMAGLTRLRDIQKGENTELEKERREKAASHRKALDMIKFTESRVVDPKVDNVMFRGDPDKEYTLDTFTEAKRNIEGLLGRTLSAEEEKPLRAIPYPPLSKDGGKDGGAVDEYLEQQKQKGMEMKEAGFVRKPDGTWAKSVVAKETLEDKLTRIMEEQRVKIQALQIYKKATVAEKKYLAEKGARAAKIFAWISGVPIGIKGQSEKKKPPKTQEEAYSFALQAKVDVNDPAIKEGILALPSGDEEGWGWFGKEYPLIPETYSAEPDEVQDREYSEEEEIDIRDNMTAYGKSREEVISAMKQRGHLK